MFSSLHDLPTTFSHTLQHPATLDLEALSGLFGSISIACWIVVFSPQILQNFRCSSADGLSISFIIIWLAGDVFNILGALLQGVLPTMIILAVYYTVADMVLLGQLWYYRGIIWRDEDVLQKQIDGEANGNIREVDGTADERTALIGSENTSTSSAQKPQTLARTVILNLGAIFAVVFAGVLGWYISTVYVHTPSTQLPGGHRSRKETPSEHAGELQFNILGQVFGYVCAALYLGSRVPQLLLNYRRKSTEGLSLLFFCFAILGNLTYVASILAYDPMCAGKHGRCAAGEASKLYGRYFLVNLSWFIGSFGTLFLDAFVFVQYMWYRKVDGDATA
jgi:uncharacterized protein with PQ loop repeat